jgi:hypothetical protein
MKRRITYIQRINAPFEPQQAVLTSKSLSVRDLDAAREDRITVGVDELPKEVSKAHRLNELHLEKHRVADFLVLLWRLATRYPRAIP